MTTPEKLAAVKQSLKNIQEKDPSTYSNYWSPAKSEYMADLEHRYQRGRSMDRYPHYYRGRSASPVSYEPRSRSLGPDSFSYYERSPSSSREVVSYTRSTSPHVFSRDYDYYYRPYYYYNYLTRPYSYDYYSYYRPYSYSSLTRPYYYSSLSRPYYSSYSPWSYYASYYRPRYYSYYDYLPYRHLSSSTLRYLLNLD